MGREEARPILKKVISFVLSMILLTAPALAVDVLPEETFALKKQVDLFKRLSTELKVS